MRDLRGIDRGRERDAGSGVGLRILCMGQGGLKGSIHLRHGAQAIIRILGCAIRMTRSFDSCVGL